MEYATHLKPAHPGQWSRAAKRAWEFFRSTVGSIIGFAACVRIVGSLLIIAPLSGLRSEPVILAWDYQTNELAGVTFRVKLTTSLAQPLTNWLTLVETTNTSVRLEMVPNNYFFAVTASNFWSKAESPFSNIVVTPAPVKTNVPVTITKP